ncbi:hypothetical protein G9P44_002342 [Scheffersomyces stipitis]|nr:hypothetical protein G9P44_002342 [Scheffersomyces stipitis]
MAAFMPMDSLARARDEIASDEPIHVSKEGKEEPESSSFNAENINDSDYAKYVYDELDEDATFQSLFDMLVEMFPMIPRNEVKMIMRLSNSFAELIDILLPEADLYTFLNHFEEDVANKAEAVKENAKRKRTKKIGNQKKALQKTKEEVEREKIALKERIKKEQAELRQQIEKEQAEKKKQIEREQAELREQLAREQATLKDVKQYHRDVYELKHIFPDHDFEVLNQQLQLSNGDIEVAIHKLLEGVPEKYVPPPTAEISNATIKKNGDRIQALIDIPLGEIFNCLRANNGQIGQTLVALIKKGVQSRKRSNSHDIQGGRVQRGNTRNVSAVSVKIINKKSPNPTIEKKVLEYSNSPEAKELYLLYNSNPSFHGISEQFLYMILNTVNGDVFKSIEICRLIIEYHCEHLTIGTGKVERRAKEPEEMTYVDAIKNKKPKQQTYGDDAMDMMSIKFESFKSRREEITHSHKTEYNVRKGGFVETIDLHNLRLATAMEHTKRALRAWWDHEMELRTVDGRMDKFGSRAACVAPFVVITGRGIHSAGGVAVIRRGVKNFLDSAGYLYDEHTGRFEVTGKI